MRYLEIVVYLSAFLRCSMRYSEGCGAGTPQYVHNGGGGSRQGMPYAISRAPVSLSYTCTCVPGGDVDGLWSHCGGKMRGHTRALIPSDCGLVTAVGRERRRHAHPDGCGWVGSTPGTLEAYAR